MTDFNCPSCKKAYCINDLEMWEVYDECGKETEFKCQSCDTEIKITSVVTGWKFEAEISE